MKYPVIVNYANLSNDRYKEGELLSYKRQYSFVVGDRRVGKTFKFTMLCVKRSLQIRGISFLWLRTTKNEIQELILRFMDDMINFDIFPEYSFYNVGNYWYAKKKDEPSVNFPIAYLGYLKNHQTIKGIPFPQVERIICDEVLQEQGVNKVKNKMYMINSIAYSIFALRPMRVILISNALTIEDEIFKYFGVKNINRPFTKSETYVIENTNYEIKYAKFREQAKNSSFGKAVKGTSYESYALDNKFLLDDMTNVVPNIKPKQEASIGVSFHNLIINFHFEKDGRIICKESKRPITFTFTPFANEVKSDIIYMRYNEPSVKKIFMLLAQKRVYYSSLSVKNAIVELRDKAIGSLNI